MPGWLSLLSVQLLISAQVMISGSVLTVWSLLGILSPLSFCPSPPLSFSLPLSKINIKKMEMMIVKILHRVTRVTNALIYVNT